mmetsp:Transcript_18346/g.45553  ORF Transcript_18346/g.45553 Transcript_18346/m.45553 type:complete len:214 (-) Transcript_18346:273-914(-)
MVWQLCSETLQLTSLPKANTAGLAPHQLLPAPRNHRHSRACLIVLAWAAQCKPQPICIQPQPQPHPPVVVSEVFKKLPDFPTKIGMEWSVSREKRNSNTLFAKHGFVRKPRPEWPPSLATVDYRPLGHLRPPTVRRLLPRAMHSAALLLPCKKLPDSPTKIGTEWSVSREKQNNNTFCAKHDSATRPRPEWLQNSAMVVCRLRVRPPTVRLAP